MALEVALRMRGNRQLRERLEDLARTMPRRAGGAMVREAEHQLRIAQERTPYKTGRLMASGMVSGWAVDGFDVLGKYGFGGASGEVPYAMAQHQRSYEHVRGERKWLSKTARAERGRMVKRVATWLDLSTGPGR